MSGPGYEGVRGQRGYGGRIVIQPFARRLRDGKYNAKNYPFWGAVVKLLDEAGYYVTQVGVKDEEQLVPDFRINVPYVELQKLVQEYDTFISGDSFLQHLGWSTGKKGIVLWGKSDPLIFGHPENVNILKSRENLRPDQFGIWEGVKYDPKVFVEPEVVMEALCTLKL